MDSSFSDHPHSSEEWKKYAGSQEIGSIPAQNESKTEGKDYWKRGVFFNVDDLLSFEATQIDVVADVLAFNPNTVIDLTDRTSIVLQARVLTASDSVHITINPDPEDGHIIILYWASQDVKFTYSIKNGKPQPLDLLGTENVGVKLIFKAGSSTPLTKWITDYEFRNSDRETRSLDTQMRIASILFWNNPNIALSLTSYVAQVTALNPRRITQNLQAISLGQQLAIQMLIGSTGNYIPALNMDKCKEDLQGLLDTAQNFQQQLDLVRNRGISIKDQLKAWDAMANRSKEQVEKLTYYLRESQEKYKETQDIVDTSLKTFEANQNELKTLEKQFSDGIDKWRKKQTIHAIADILGAVIGFAISIGTLFLGGSSSPVDVDKVIDTVEKVEEAGKQAGQFLQSDVLKKVLKSGYAIYKLYPDVKNAIKIAESLNKISDPTHLKDVQGGAADANAEMALAAWDKWVLDSDDQMGYAVDQKIEGAAAFRAALRKHAINGKELARVEAEAIKAGHEYIHATLELRGAENDFARLKDLRQEDEKAQVISGEAEAKLFDRYLSVRTSIMIQMRNLTWAYKYATLESPLTQVNILGDVQDDRLAMDDLIQSFRRFQEKHWGGPSDLDPGTLQAKDFPPPFNSRLVQDLKDNFQTSFTYIPGIKTDFRYSGPFREGSHFRVTRLELDLIGATSKVTDHNSPQFQLHISTSGVYSDVKNGVVFHFVGPRLQKPYCYNKDAKTGKQYITIPFSVDINDYTAPPPFTTWTITLKNHEELDLSQLVDVTLTWHGKFAETGF